MSKHIGIAVGFILGATVICAPAWADSRVNWSVAVTTPGYYYTPPPAVVYPQSQFIYGAPPSVYSPPAVYQPPTVVYVQPPAAVYYDSRGFPVYVQQNGNWHNRHDWNNRSGGHHWGNGNYRR